MCFSGPGGKKRDFEKDPIPLVYGDVAHLPTEMWMLREMSWAQLGIQKAGTWLHLEQWVLPCFHPYFEDMKSLFVELAACFWPPPPAMEKSDYDRRINSPVTYEQVLDIFKKYREIVEG